jgi:hypothetical protein
MRTARGTFHPAASCCRSPQRKTSVLAAFTGAGRVSVAALELEVGGAEFPVASFAVFRDEFGGGTAGGNGGDEDGAGVLRRYFGFLRSAYGSVSRRGTPLGSGCDGYAATARRQSFGRVAGSLDARNAKAASEHPGVGHSYGVLDLV